MHLVEEGDIGAFLFLETDVNVAGDFHNKECTLALIVEATRLGCETTHILSTPFRFVWYEG